MPTGYTQSIVDNENIQFKDFALLCSRAFGALIDMRDDNLDAPIPSKVKPSQYHFAHYGGAIRKLNSLKNLSKPEKEAIASKRMLQDISYHLKEIEKGNSLATRYNKILSEVKKWKPPTKEHIGIKRFMAEQIESSISYDCSDCHQKAIKELLGMSPIAYFNKNILSKVKWDLDYHRKENRKEKARAKGKTKWIQKLMISLGVNPNNPVVPDMNNKNQSFQDKQLTNTQE